MPGRYYPYISREIWILLSILFLAGVLTYHFYSLFFTLPIWLLISILAYYYRDPERLVPSQPLAVVSPVDATVTGIDTVPNPYIEGEAIRIELKMSHVDIFRVRSPIEGKVINGWFLLPGDPLPLQQGPVGSLRLSHWIQTDEGDSIVLTIRKISRLFRPRCDIQTGERIGQGQRCGIIEFGAMVDVYVPVNSRLEIILGDKVKSGSNVLAQLQHSDKQ